MKIIAKIIVIMLFLFLNINVGISSAEEHWETDYYDVEKDPSCFEVDPLWILAVQLDRQVEAISRLDQDASIEINEEKISYWSDWQDNRLENLKKLQTTGRPDVMKPFLIRAVAKHKHPKGFAANECDVGVAIRHGSLGNIIPDTKRYPVIIFLTKLPMKIYASWEMAK